MDEPTTFTVPQSAISVELGIAAPTLRKMRSASLAEGVDWITDGNQVLYTEAAREKLRAQIHGAQPPETPRDESPAVTTRVEAETQPQAQPASQPSPENVSRVRVMSQARDINGRRQHFPNPRVIRAEHLTDVEPRLAWVRVSHSRNYARRTNSGEEMILDVQLIDGLWHASGRAPRFPGRW